VSQQIIKQPNGRYGVFSSITATFVVYDATPEEIIEYWLESQKKEITEKVRETVAVLERGEKPYYQFTLSFDEALAIIKEVHGADHETLKFFEDN